MASNKPTNMQFDFEDQAGPSLHEASDDQLDDHGLVDMQTHNSPDTRVGALEDTFATLNAFLSHLTTLFNEFVTNFAFNGTSGVPIGGATHVVMPPIGTIVFAEPVGTTNTHEGAMDQV